MANECWRAASLYERTIVTNTMLLKKSPEKGFATQIHVTVKVALLVDQAAVNSGVAVGVLSMLLTSHVGDKTSRTRVQNRLANIKKGVSKVANKPQRNYSPESLKQRLESTFWLPTGVSFPRS